MTGPIAGHLVLHTVGLVVVGVVVIGARRLWRRDPILGYRILLGALLAALVLPLAQSLVHGRWHAGAAVARTVESSIREVASRALLSHAPPGKPRTAAAARVVMSAPSPRPETPPAPAPAALRSFALDALLGTLWLLGALVIATLHGVRLLRTRRLLARAWPVEAPERRAAFRRASNGSPLADRVRLLESRAVDAPACWGLRHPTIVLPLDASRDGGPALEWALLHELVHLERNDPRDALGQRLLTTIFWFHPVAWWLSRELDRMRELSCDLLVVRRGGRRRSYALALLDAAARDAGVTPRTSRLAVPSTAAGHLLPWSPSPSQLRRRIEMLSTSRNPLSKRKKLTYGVGAALVLSAGWAGQLAIASTFDAGEEVVVARCDPTKKQKKKAKQENAPWTAPRQGDIVRGEGARETVPIRFDEQEPSWVTPRGVIDHEVRDSLVRTLLNDDSAEVRAAAAQSLSAHIGDETVKKAFLRAIGDGCDKTRGRLLEDLLRHEAISGDMRDLLVRLFDADGEARSAVTGAVDAFEDRPEARQVLIASVQNARDSVVQLSATEALAPHVEDSHVRGALLNALKRSKHEVARMAMIDALEPYVAEPEVRELYEYLIPRDDNEVAVQAMADALARRSEEAGVRATMIDILLGDRDDLIKMKFTDALAPYVHEPEVKRAFIAILPKLGSDVIRMRMVTALASLVDTTAPRGREGRRALPLPKPAGDSIVPVMRQKRG